MTRTSLYTGTLMRAHHADEAQAAHGIYRWDRTARDQPWQGPFLTPTVQPGWICMAPDRRTLYALNEVKALEGEPGGAVSAFAIDPANGDLSPVGLMRLPGNPCHALVDASGRYLLVATFHGGTIHLIRLGVDGALEEEVARHQHQGSSIHPKRQTSPHPHGIAIRPDNKIVIVPDLGTDRIEVYAFDADAGTLTPHPELGLAMPPGSGPRHGVFSADGRHAYVINEMNATVAVLAVDVETGALGLLQMLDLLPEGFTGARSGGEIALDCKGTTLYASTRSHGSSGLSAAPGLDTLIWLTRDRETGLLSPAGRIASGGGIPRAFILDQDGRHLLVAHQCTGTVISFAIDPVYGSLSESGGALRTPVPVSLVLSEAD